MFGMLDITDHGPSDSDLTQQQRPTRLQRQFGSNTHLIRMRGLNASQHRGYTATTR